MPRTRTPNPGPADAAAAVLGRRGETVPLSASGSAFVVRAGAAAVVAKRVPAHGTAAAYEELFRRLRVSLPDNCPELLALVPTDAGTWWAVLEYAEPTRPTGARDRADVLALLAALRDVGAVPGDPVEAVWLEHALCLLRDDEEARRAAATLLRTVPGGPRTLAHGDFNLPNLVRSGRRLVLVDWEQVGSAPAGLDAGWLLALARAGADVPWPADGLRRDLARAFPPENLVWFEVAGLVRLLVRMRGFGLPPAVRRVVELPIRRALRSSVSQLE